MNILLVQTSFVGDIILSTPVIAGIKQLYPTASLTVLTTRAGQELLARDPLVAKVEVFEKRGAARGLRGLWQTAKLLGAQRWDRAYVLHRSFRTAMLIALLRPQHSVGFEEARWGWVYDERVRRTGYRHEVLRNLALLTNEAPLAHFDTALRLFAPSVSQCSATVQELLQRRYVLIAPGSVWATKRWSAEHYRSLAEQLVREGWEVAITGAPNEREVCEFVARDLDARQLAGSTSLAEMLCLVQHAQAVVCNDSSVLHMASAFQVPTVAVFCSTTPEFGFGPRNVPAIIVERNDLQCKPCGRHGRARCPIGTEECMRGVEVRTVWNAVQQLLPPKNHEVEHGQPWR